MTFVEQGLLFPESSSLPSPAEMALFRERDQLVREAREIGEIGTRAHLRKWEAVFTADQKKAADTCVVELYTDGQGLRVERRSLGYSWKGKSTGFVTVGEGDERQVLKEGQGEGGKRGTIKEFSKASAARFRDTVYKISRHVVPVMVTLTYPEMRDPQRVKDDLDAFLAAMKRKYPRACGVWKLEPQERGVPHYHLLVWGRQPWKNWVSVTWARIVGSDNPDHEKVGTKVEKLRSYRGTLAYCGKLYLSKGVDGAGYNWGRFWGVFNRKCLPLSEFIRVEAPWRVGLWFSRIIRRHFRAKTGGKCRTAGRGRVLWQSSDFAAQWLRVLEWAEGLAEPGRVLLAECPF